MTVENIKLIDETKGLVKKENEINADIIRNLILIFNQKLHLEMGYGSEFAFCEQELGMPDASIQRRLDAVRLSRAVKDLPERIEAGTLSLNKVGKVAQFLRQEKRVCDRDFTKKEVESIVDTVQVQKRTAEVEQVLSKQSDIASPPVQEKARFKAGGRQTLEIEVDEETIELLNQIKDLTSHQGFRTNGAIIKMALKYFASKNHPAQKATKFKSRKACALPQGSKTSRRYISEQLRQRVWRKHESSCSFNDPRTGKRCGSTFRLQIEHIHPIALGGDTIEENLTLLCQRHNLLAAERLGLHKKQRQQNLFT